MTPGFWRGRRVFLTGHTGFKGSWLSLWLQQLGAAVTGFSLPPPTTPSLFDEAGIAAGMTSLTGDIRDFSLLQSAVQSAQPEIVIHLAAQSLVRYGYQFPMATYATNVMGTVHLLEAIRHTPGVRAVLVITTDKCYENRESPLGYRETDALGGADPYSSSKACAELLSAAWRRSYFNAEGSAALATARAGNVIGGGDWATDRLIPDIIRAILAGEPPGIRNPDAIRPWQFVLEPLRGYLCLAEKLCTHGTRFAEAWNFGPVDTDARTVGEIADHLCKNWGQGAHWLNRKERKAPHETTCLKLDIAKAADLLHWKPRLSLETALDWTLEWYRRRQAGEKAGNICLEQIERYG